MTVNIQNILMRYGYDSIEQIKNKQSLLYTIIKQPINRLLMPAIFQAKLNQKLADVRSLVNELVAGQLTDNINHPNGLLNTTALLFTTKFVTIMVFPQYSEILEILLRAKADTKIADQLGNTPLHVAIKQNDDNTVQMLINYGADVEQVDRNGHTPLARAQQKNNAAIIKLIESVLSLRDLSTDDDNTQKPVEPADSKINNVADILQKFGYSDVNEIMNEQSLIYQVIDIYNGVLSISDRVKAVKILLFSGEVKNINLIGNYMTPLAELVRAISVDDISEYIEIGKLFLSHGVDYTQAFKIALLAGNKEILELLVDHAANVESKMVLSTLLKTAILHHNKFAMELLSVRGAQLDYTEEDDIVLILEQTLKMIPESTKITDYIKQPTDSIPPVSEATITTIEYDQPDVTPLVGQCGDI